MLTAVLATMTATVASYANPTTVVDQVRQRFSVSALSLLTGDKIQYINHDDVRHNIKIVNPDDSEIDKGLQDPEKTIEVEFTKIGTYIVRCSIHQKMKMKVVVR